MPISVGLDVEEIVDVLMEVEDWKELAGRLGINSFNIEESCSGTAIPRCCRRQLVRTHCDKSSDEPIANIIQILEKMNKKKQAKKLRQKLSLSELLPISIFLDRQNCLIIII